MDRWRLSVGVPVIEPHGVFTPNTFQAVYSSVNFLNLEMYHSEQ